MMKINKKTVYVSLIAIATAIAVTLTVFFSSVAYAWLINYVKGDFRFVAGEPDPFTLEIAKIKVLDSTTEYTEANREYCQTVKSSVTNENDLIESNGDGTHYEADLKNMSFGSIDNVAQLKDENVVYLRLTVPKSLGDTVILNLHYSVSDFIVLYKTNYDASGNAVIQEVKDGETDENGNVITTIADLLSVEYADKANDSFLLYDAVVSNTAYDATVIETNLGEQFNVANYKRFVKVPDYNNANLDELALEKQNYDNNTITLVNANYDAVAEGGNYYIYVKVVPNLSVFAYSIEYISDIMPCYMFFKIGASFESGPNP